MTRLVLIFLCAIIGCLADPECGENEFLDNCPVDSAANYCPKNEKEALQGSSSTPDPCPPPACKCRINYRYASRENKTCIPTRECPPFKCNRPYEEFNPCPPYCPTDSCSQASPDGSCPKRFGQIKILLICAPKCRCIKNYWRQDGVCIPYAQCPQNRAPVAEATTDSSTPETPSSDQKPAIQADPENTPQDDITYNEYTLPHADTGSSSSAFASAESSAQCESSSEEKKEKICSGPNEEYVLEKQTCPPELCYAITARIDCRNEPPRQPGCACKSGYFRLNETSPCEQICKCPQMANSPDCL